MSDMDFRKQRVAGKQAVEGTSSDASFASNAMPRNGAERNYETVDDAKAGEFRDKQDLVCETLNDVQASSADGVATKESREEPVPKLEPGTALAVAREGEPGTPAESLGLPAAAPMKRGGRRTLMTPELEEKVSMLLSLGMSRRQAAVYLDIDHKVIARAIERDEEFAHNVQRAEELSTVQPLLTVIGEARKNWRAATWLLERKRNHRPRLTEEEKAERQQERLADAQRKIELERNVRIMKRLAAEEEAAYHEARAEAKRKAAWEKRYPKRKKKTTNDEAPMTNDQ